MTPPSSTSRLIPNYRTPDETATDAGAMLFYQLCGMNVERAKAVRAAFKRLLPMPGTFAYD